MNCAIRRMLKLEDLECPHKEQVGTCQYFCSPILVFDLCPYREKGEKKCPRKEIKKTDQNPNVIER